MSKQQVYVMQRNSGAKDIFICDQFINAEYGNQLAQSMDATLLGVRSEGLEPIKLDTPYQLKLARPSGPCNKLHYREQSFPIFMKNDFAKSYDSIEGSFVFEVLLPTLANNIYAVAQVRLEDCYDFEFASIIESSSVEFTLEAGQLYLKINGRLRTQLAAMD